MASAPRTAMVLAAGLGKRMRPLTDRMPKPLVPVAGKPLIDHVLDRLAAAGVERAVVNVHYLADQIETPPRRPHTRRRSRSRTSAAKLLDTGGGVVKALAALGGEPFFHVNSDTIWIDGVKPNLERLAAAFDPARMDALLLLAPAATSIGYAGRGDFTHGAGRPAARGAASARWCRSSMPARRSCRPRCSPARRRAHSR